MTTVFLSVDQIIFDKKANIVLQKNMTLIAFDNIRLGMAQHFNMAFLPRIICLI